MVCDGLGITDWAIARKIHNAMPDFVRRGEIHEFMGQPVQYKRRQNTKRYKYNHAWRRAGKGKNKPRILKAIYISGMFAASDIERLSGAGRNHVDRTIKLLAASGSIIIVGRRRCATGTGAERLYNVANREQFKIEVMG
jgi:hypothetical protein